MSNHTDTLEGTYGGSKTPCTVFVYWDYDGRAWYAVEGSCNVNCTYDRPALESPVVDVETINDCDCITWPDGIDSEETLETAVNA